MRAVIFVLIAAVLAGLAALYGLFGPSQEGQNKVINSDISESEESAAAVSEIQILTGETTLGDITKLGRNLECKISYVAPDIIEPVIGTYFVSNDRTRGDFIINTPEYPDGFVSSMIFANQKFYSWSKIGEEKYGIKLDTAAVGEYDRDMLREPVPPTGSVSYQCSKWENVDGSVFVPPGDVLFKDLSELMQAGMEYGTVYEE